MTQSAVSALQGQNSTASYNSRSKKSAADSSSSDRLDPAAHSQYRDSPDPYDARDNNSYAAFNQQPSMNGVAGTAPPGTMYVRALYDYDADDRTSLSFHEGDIIQVITQLESGWWDGVINGVRGWFPSNYCQTITSVDELPEPDHDVDRDHADEEPDDVDVYDESFDDDDDDDSDHDDTSGLPMEGTEVDKSRADFWIPQATPDGRLFYYNTMTGESSMELPLESPSSTNETGPRDRMNVNVPDKTRPPPEMMARGLMQDEEDESDVNSASELEGESIMMGTRSALVSCTWLTIQSHAFSLAILTFFWIEWQTHTAF
jgi:son of sevenless-like protein